MTELQSKIILCKGIDVDRDYVNVLNYTEQQMVELCSNVAHKINERNNYSFINVTEKIYVDFTYDECLRANYIAFQNPHYSNKWFFAWIDDITLKSESSVELSFTVDAWSTWFSKWSPKSCFVNREHVNNDTIGINTQSESVNTGNTYIANSTTGKIFNRLSVLITRNYKEDDVVHGHYFSGIYNGLKYDIFNYPVSVESIDNVLEQHKQEIVRIEQFPSWISANNEFSRSEYVDLPNNNTLDGYVPVNQKLLTFPYKRYHIVSTSGGETELKPELFGESKQLQMMGGLVPSSYMIIFPINYNGHQQDITNIIRLDSNLESAWSSDTYINGIMDKKTNDMLNLISNGVNGISNIGVGMASQDLSGSSVYNSTTNLLNGIDDYVRERNKSGTVHGTSGSNSGDFQTGIFGFYIFEETIKREFAEAIDSYFTRFGYAINKTKVPNITGRRNWNYVEIGGHEDIVNGDVPSKYTEIINNACRKGVTIWHHHSSIGNFTLDNSII